MRHADTSQRRNLSAKAMLSTSAGVISQAAAIPLRGGRVCLINSSSGRGWIIPKGRIEPGQTAAETALREAWEEAGLRGTLAEGSVGSYLYRKNGADYHVTVFLMHVTKAAVAWAEDDRRQRRWIPAHHAGRFVQDPGLREVLTVLNELEALVG